MKHSRSRIALSAAIRDAADLQRFVNAGEEVSVANVVRILRRKGKHEEATRLERIALRVRNRRTAPGS